VTIELEPARVEVSEALSAEAQAGIEPALALVRAETGQAPLLRGG
jgi:hypothetical protein